MTNKSDSKLEAAFARLEDLVPGASVVGVAGDVPVRVIDIRWHGSNFVVLTYEDGHGRTDQTVLGRDRESSLSLFKPGRTRAFDGEPDAWRLAAEALRIRYAALFDPMLAITTSDLQPLPHQIKAVYGDLLPRSPLRYLLADDPGAGKTIMCGLYVKELVLRGDLARCLVVAPGSLVDQWMDELYTIDNADTDGNPELDQLQAASKEVTSRLATSGPAMVASGLVDTFFGGEKSERSSPLLRGAVREYLAAARAGITRLVITRT